MRSSDVMPVNGFSYAHDPKRYRDLDYRSLFRGKSRRGRPFVEEFGTALDAWLRKKNLSPDKLQEGVTNFTPNNVGLFVNKNRRDGSRLQKFSLVETRRDTGEVWQTEIVVSQDRSGAADVFVLVSDPRKANSGGQKITPTGVPGIVRSLLGSADVTDGLVPLREESTTLHPEDEDHLIDMICDPDRHLPLIVAPAVSDSTLDDFRAVVEEVTKGVVGQAGVFVLTAALVDSMNGEVGLATLPRGGLRIFPPGFDATSGFDPASRQDVKRSYYLSGENLDARDRGRVLGHWAWMARAGGNAVRLPRKIQRDLIEISQHNQRQLIDDIDALLKAQPQLRQPPQGEAERVSPKEVSFAPEGVRFEKPEAVVSFDATLGSVLRDSMSDDGIVDTIWRLGGETSLAESLEICILMASEYPKLRAKLEESIEQANLVQDTTSKKDDLEEMLDLLTENEELEDEIDSLRQELDAARSANRYLSGQITSLGAWNKFTATTLPVEYQNDFQSVLDHARDLDHIEFTGDVEITLDLDETQVAQVAAGVAHAALDALNDYARAKEDGRFTAGGIREFLQNPPSGCETFSERKFAASESGVVQGNPKYVAARTFPMVNGDEVFMEMHVKLHQRSPTPRMHLIDDTAESGKIVIGYIGPHLPSNLTT